MSIAICPGSFDPITLGHLNIIRRTSKIFDRVIVCIMHNAMKPNPMFTVEEKVEMVRKATQRYPNVTVDWSDGLLAEYARQYPGAVIVKGLRAASDFESSWKPCSSPPAASTPSCPPPWCGRWPSTART